MDRTELMKDSNIIEMSDPELDISNSTHKEHDTPGTNRKKNTTEVQDLSNASEKTSSVSPGRGGDDEVEEINGKEDEKKKGKVTSPRDESNPLNKRKVSPSKPYSQNKSRSTLTKM
jgi:hypothetical protein